MPTGEHSSTVQVHKSADRVCVTTGTTEVTRVTTASMIKQLPNMVKVFITQPNSETETILTNHLLQTLRTILCIRC